MAKQLTLFGKVVPSSVYAQPIMKNISKGIEVWADSRGDVLKAAQSDWKGVYASVWECILYSPLLQLMW